MQSLLKAKEIVLEPRYMCPVLERPLYDAVYIKVKGGDKLLAVSDELAKAWLIKKQTTCASVCRNDVRCFFKFMYI